MADQGKLSEERLELIRRFMGEPASRNGAVEVVEPESSPVPATNGNSPADVAPALVAGAPTRERALPVSAHARLLWYRIDLRWPILVVILGLLVGLVLAR